MKPGYRLFQGDQIPTRPVTIQEIVAMPTFALGVADVRARRGVHQEKLRSMGHQWTVGLRARAHVGDARAPAHPAQDWQQD